MLRGVVASLWVNAAVKGGPCPVIMAAGATNQSVTNVIEAFGRAPHPDESYRLGQRWLPELVSFGAYLPAKGRIQDNAEDYRDFLVLYEPDEAGWSALYRYYQRLPDILDPATSLDLEPAWLSRVKEAGLGERQEIEAAINRSANGSAGWPGRSPGSPGIKRKTLPRFMKASRKDSRSGPTAASNWSTPFSPGRRPAKSTRSSI